MPEVGQELQEEKAGYVRRAPESPAAVVQGMAGFIHKVAQDDKDNLVGKMFKVFEAYVVSISDAHVENESRLEGIHQGPQTEDVLSQKTEQIFKRKFAKQASKQKLCVWSMSLLTQRKMFKQQDMGFKDPPILQQIQMDQQSVGIRDPPTLQISQNPIHINKGYNLINENRMNLKTQYNNIPQKQQQNLEQLIQESLCSLEADQLTDQETISKISKHVASIHPIGDPIDHSQSDSCITYQSGTGKEAQDTQIKSLLEEHQHLANIPIGGRLTHFVEAWKLIGADALVTRGIKAFWINTQAPQILERNMTNPVKIRSKDSQLDPSKLIDKEL
ncbi:MAG: hypothetical protein EZS28_041123, partial [Streblomastix strix]